jgi:L-lactate dehydrogenase complex protein LldG
MTSAETIDLLLQNASKVAAGTHRVEAKEKLQDTIAELVPAGALVFCPKTTEIEKSAISRIANIVPDYLTAQVAVEEVSAAIAENGSIVCTSAGGKAVQASLLPAHHIALVPKEKIFATLDDFFAAQTGVPPTNMTIITGPSRTADIELNLVIGVHGPEKLDIIVI